jgi:flagellar motor switch protein FliN/FliY
MAGDSDQIGQNEIDALLRQAPPAAAPAAVPAAIRAASPTDASAAISQGEIEALLAGASAPRTATAGAASTGASSSAGSMRLDADMQFLLAQAEQALASVDRPSSSDLAGLTPYQLRDFGGAPASSEKATLELLRDVELDLKIELGRTHMVLEEVLKLRKGSVVPLDKLAGDPVDIYVNGRLIARGEVLVLNDNFCVRVAELLATEEAA